MFKTKKNNREQGFKNDQSLLDCEIVKRVAAKVNDMSRYNECIKMCMESAKIMAKIDVNIVNGCVKTKLRNITFESKKKFDGVNRRYTLVVSPQCIMYFDEEKYTSLFTYSNWEELLNM